MILVKPSYEILTALNRNDVLRSIERAGRTCYKSEDRITTDSAERFCRMLVSSGHESVIEHVSLSVRFIVDRGVTHELVRHRLASYSQESTRYCNYGKAGHVTFVIPPWVQIEPGDYRAQPATGQHESYRWGQAMFDAERYYLELLRGGWTPQQARSVLPNSTKTEIVTTANLREWRHILRLRTSEKAHPQMREVMVPLLTELCRVLPQIFSGC